MDDPGLGLAPRLDRGAAVQAAQHGGASVTNASVAETGDKLTGSSTLRMAKVKDPEIAPLLEVTDTLSTLFYDLSEFAVTGLMALVIQASKSDEVLRSGRWRAAWRTS
ncbi:hypothetical protein [Streptomyces sp. NPDC094472]|uniref:hypothetical protein n=1 Tax=Streptomyces sp. NPDC094472 TaxID=3155080 RepID=UPI00332655A9